MPSDHLTPAENAVIDLLLEGLSNRAIAERQILSVRTVESHISHALEKTGCRSRLELVLWQLARSEDRRPRPAGKLPVMPA